MEASPIDLGELLARDSFAQAMGIEFIEGRVGRVVLEMTLADRHLNFLGRGHGGVAFALADMAFGLASNAAGEASFGVDAHIAYAKGANKGDRLRATAEEVSRNRKIGIYRVDVDIGGNRIATFTGTVAVTGKPLSAFEA